MKIRNILSAALLTVLLTSGCNAQESSSENDQESSSGNQGTLDFKFTCPTDMGMVRYETLQEVWSNPKTSDGCKVEERGEDSPTPIQEKALKTGFAFSAAGNLSKLYEICSRQNGLTVVDSSSNPHGERELKAAFMLCPDHPAASVIEASITASDAAMQKKDDARVAEAAARRAALSAEKEAKAKARAEKAAAYEAGEAERLAAAKAKESEERAAAASKAAEERAAAAAEEAEREAARKAYADGTRVDDGNYLVGADVQPGTWQSVGAKVVECYWEISDAQGNIIDNNFINIAPQFTITVPASASGFTVSGCSFQRIGE